MDIIAAYREVGSYRAAAAISGTTPKTVKRVIARHEGGGAPQRAPRAHNYDDVAGLVAGKVKSTQGRISAKRLLPVARAAGYAGSARNFRRLVAERKRLWRGGDHPGGGAGGGGAGGGPGVRLGGGGGAGPRRAPGG